LSTGQSTVFDLGTIAETFRHFEKLDIVIVGIGAIVPEVIAFDETEKRAGINGRTTTIAAVLVALALGGAATAKPLRTLAQGELRVGTYFVNPPFEYIARGARVGFEVNLMEEIARQLGLKPIFVNTRWETILKEMQDGRYDCIVGGITITPARERILAWSVPYVTTTLSLMMNSAKTPGICSLADMKGALVGVQGGDHGLRRSARNAEARPDWRHKGLPVRPDRGGDDGSCCGAHHSRDEGRSSGGVVGGERILSAHRGASS
jgi:hypothetical protein